MKSIHVCTTQNKELHLKTLFIILRGTLVADRDLKKGHLMTKSDVGEDLVGEYLHTTIKVSLARSFN